MERAGASVDAKSRFSANVGSQINDTPDASGRS